MARPYRPAELEWQLFNRRQALDRGLLSAHQLRSAAWFRIRHDVYADARLERDHELACRAAAMGLPEQAVIAGPSAAALWGVGHAASFASDVHVIMPADRRVSPRRGLRIHVTRLAPDEVGTEGDVRRTTPVRTAWDLAGWLNVVEAVGAIDGLLGSGLVGAGELAAMADERRGQRGSALARRAFSLADGRAQSPPESRLRVHLVLAGLPAPVPQFPVTVRGGLILHPDLAFPRYLVAVEYDGAWHAATDQLHRDRRRLNQLAASGWIVLHVTSDRMRRDLPSVISEIREALKSRGWRP